MRKNGAGAVIYAVPAVLRDHGVRLRMLELTRFPQGTEHDEPIDADFPEVAEKGRGAEEQPEKEEQEEKGNEAS